MGGGWIPDEIFYAQKAAKGQGGGKGKGGGGGWIPDEIFYAQKAAQKGGGGGWGGGGCKGGWGAKGGLSVWSPMAMMKGQGKGQQSGLKSFPGNVRVWIGGLPQMGYPDVEMNKRLKQHMSSTGVTCLYAEVFSKGGQGGAAFKTEQDAQQAIATLNGSFFDNSLIQVDVLTRKSQ